MCSSCWIKTKFRRTRAPIEDELRSRTGKADGEYGERDDSCDGVFCWKCQSSEAFPRFRKPGNVNDMINRSHAVFRILSYTLPHCLRSFDRWIE